MRKQHAHVRELHRTNRVRNNLVLTQFKPDAFAQVKKPTLFGRIAKIFNLNTKEL